MKNFKPILLTVVSILFFSSSLLSKEIKESTQPQLLIQQETFSLLHMQGMGAMTIQEFLELTPRKIKALSGQRLKVKDRMALLLTQRAIKKQLKNGQEAHFEDASYDFSLGGFLLGFLLGLLGVLIALILFPNNVFRSSLVGLLSLIVVLLLGIFLF